MIGIHIIIYYICLMVDCMYIKCILSVHTFYIYIDVLLDYESLSRVCRHFDMI